jgi:plasmid stabilization system protein ParE
MVNKIAWSKTSLAELGQILIYFRDEVSESTSERFADLVKLKISQLAANTFDGRPVPTRKNIRFILLGKNHRLYYRRHGQTLFITRFYDTRQNPSKRPYLA